MDVPKQNLKIYQGRTLFFIVRWETLPFIYKPITGITKAAPARVTANTHGLKTGWRAAIISVQGMTQINAKSLTIVPKETDWHKATYIDPNTVEFNDINASQYTDYVSGGYLQYYTPKDMPTGTKVRMNIKDKDGGTDLLVLSTEGGSPAIVADNTNHTITITVPATLLTGITWTKGVYDIEVETPDGIITPIQRGSVSVIPERTVN